MSYFLINGWKIANRKKCKYCNFLILYIKTTFLTNVTAKRSYVEEGH